MGSISAMENGSKDRYFQSNAKKLVPEGVKDVLLTRDSLRIPYSRCWAVFVPVWDIAVLMISKSFRRTVVLLRSPQPHSARAIRMISTSQKRLRTTA